MIGTKMAIEKIEFGTDGFRAIIADGFTFENVEKITIAILKHIKNKTSGNVILIGYDPRFMADEFATFCAETIAKYGFSANVSSSICPTPTLAYCATIAKDCAGAIMFTASHNPKNYLGIKFIPNYGGPASKSITNEIEAMLENKEALEISGQKGEIKFCDFKTEYFSKIEKIINFELIKKTNIKFIYDGLYSASIGYFDELLKNHEINFESVNCIFDPNFGGGLPEPKEKYMLHKKTGFLTFANDGDADRYGVIDEIGEWTSPNIILAMLLKYLVEEKGKKGHMIKTVGVSALVDIVAKKLNVETITTAVGFKWICEKMLENEAILAGEDSGGLSIGEHIPEKDGILANLLILEMVAKTQKPLCELKKEILEFANCEFFQDRVDVKLGSKEEMKEIQGKFLAMSKIATFEISEKLKIDGVKFYLGEEKTSWVLMRPSGTEPLLRFYIESNSRENLEEIRNFIKSNIN